MIAQTARLTHAVVKLFGETLQQLFLNQGSGQKQRERRTSNAGRGESSWKWRLRLGMQVRSFQKRKKEAKSFSGVHLIPPRYYAFLFLSPRIRTWRCGFLTLLWPHTHRRPPRLSRNKLKLAERIAVTFSALREKKKYSGKVYTWLHVFIRFHHCCFKQRTAQWVIAATKIATYKHINHDLSLWRFISCVNFYPRALSRT